MSRILFARGVPASVHAGILPHPPPGTRQIHPPLALGQGRYPLAQCMLGDMVNKQVVCILLECNLVYNFNSICTPPLLTYADHFQPAALMLWTYRHKSRLTLSNCEFGLASIWNFRTRIIGDLAGRFTSTMFKVSSSQIVNDWKCNEQKTSDTISNSILKMYYFKIYLQKICKRKF